MASIDDLRGWFERDLRFAKWVDNVNVCESDSDTIDLQLYTDTNEYLLTISSDDESSYMSAVVRSRKARAGQTETQYRRLFPLGRIPFNERAWKRLLGCIVGLELVRVQRRIEATVEADGAPVK